MFGIMIDGLVGDMQFGCGAEGFTGAWIAHKAWMGAAGNLEAYALALAEVVSGWPDVDLKMQAAVWLRSYAVWREAVDTVAQVDRLAGWLYDTETGEEVGVLQAGAHVEISCDGADDVHIMIEYGTGIDKDIWTSFQFAIVLCSHTLAVAERVSTDGRGGIGGIIAIVVWFRCRRWRSCKRAFRLEIPELALCRGRPVREVTPLIDTHHEETNGSLAKFACVALDLGLQPVQGLTGYRGVNGDVPVCPGADE